MTLRFGDFELSPDTYELRRAHQPVHLEPRVFEVLAYLVTHRERVVTKQELLATFWADEFVSESALSRAVRDARRALGDTGAKDRWIHTVHGRGFRFVGDVSRPGEPKGLALAAGPGPPAVAVLPLEDLSADGPRDFFAAGMTDALITELAKVGSLKVISRTSVMRYQGARKPLPEIARELGVERIVQGTVLRDGGRVRITAQLVRADTDEHLWAESYEREMRDVLTLQAEVAQAIAHQVDVRLAPQEKPPEKRPEKPPGKRSEIPRVAGRRQVEPEVFLLDLEGRHFIAQRGEGAFRKASLCFERAIAADPTYAPAHAGLAEAYAMLGNYGAAPPAEVEAPAREAAERALRLAPDLAEAHRTLALVRWQFAFDWRAAEQGYHRALELDPNSSLVHYWQGICWGVQARFDSSLDALERARGLDPLSLNVVAVTGWMHYFASRFREALPYYRHVLAVDPNHLLARWFLGEALVELGEFREGLRELGAALDLSRRGARFVGYLGYASGRAGRPDEARALLREIEGLAGERYVPPYFPALIHAGLGDHERALDELERAWTMRDSMLRDLAVDPPWAVLHGEPRYRTLLSRLRLTSPAG
jgi:TolB-like protein/tetratricopeptide (TPR) repeat protein